MKRIFHLVFILCFLIFSCEKNQNAPNQNAPKDYSGTYDCLVYGSSFNIFDSTTWGASGPPTQTTLDVVQNGSFITVDNDFTFHCDSVADENTYTEYQGSTDYTIRFYSNDSIYYRIYSGGLGGSWSSNYVGKKM